MKTPSVSLLFFIVTFLSTSLSVVDFSNCSFETSLCGWNWTLTGSDVDWRVENFQGSEGRFLYAGLVGSFRFLREHVTVQSRVLTPLDNVCAIKFSYAFYSYTAYPVYATAAATVSVLAVQGPRRYITKSLYSTNKYWREAILTINIASPSAVEFALTLGHSAGFLALDNIQFLSCSVCTFEDDLCEWTPQSRSWIRQTSFTGPFIDHTLGSSAGYYLIAEHMSIFQQPVLKGQELSYSDNICGVAFAYYLAKVKGSLTVTMQTTGGYIVSSWNVNGYQADLHQWHQANLTTEFWNNHANIHKVLQVQISASVSLFSYHGVAIDDLEYLPCVQFDECTFGLNFCTWRNSRHSKLQWLLETNEADSTHNKLTVDLSNEEISDGDMASLVGVTISQSDNSCSLKIVYELYGQLLHTKLFVRVHHLTDDRYTFVNLTNSNSNTTSSGIEIQEIGLTDFPLVVFIETGKTKEEQGKMIIHSLQYLPCQKSTFEQTTNVIWHNSSPDMNAMKWELQSSVSNLSHLGDENRNFIITSGPGLAHLEADFHRFHGQPVCSIRFSYLAHGCYNISVATKDNHSTLFATRHWLATPSATWQRLEGVILSPEKISNVSAIVIEATPVGDGSDAQLAIDDIELLPCIDFETCMFERGLCGWTPSVTDSHDAIWIRWYGYPPSSLITDNMDLIENGYYLYVHVSNEAKHDGVAVLQGVPVTQDSHICGIRLSYYIGYFAQESYDFATLSVVFVFKSGRTVVVWSSGTEASLWHVMNQWNLIEARYHVLKQGHFELRANVSKRGEDTNLVTVIMDNVTHIECVTTNEGLDSFEIENNFNDSVHFDLDSACPELVPSMPLYNSKLKFSKTRTHGLLPSKLPSSSAFLYVENASASGLSEDKRNFPYHAMIGVFSALLVFVIILIVIVLIATSRRKVNKLKKQDIVLASSTSPRINVRYG
jgi:hypothetical protein